MRSERLNDDRNCMKYIAIVDTYRVSIAAPLSNMPPNFQYLDR